MDFSIFSKPLSVPGLGKLRAAKARAGTLQLIQNQAANGEQMIKFTTTREGTATERARAAASATHIPSMEVGGGPDTGLSAALENAALLHASGQSEVALKLLAGAISNDPDTRCLARAWHSQFDLLQRADDREGFEQLALEYVTQFESSPPPWDERRKAAAKAQRVLAGYFAISQINVKTALEIPARAARYSSLKIDVATVKVFDDIGCRRMVDVLRRLRRLGYPVVMQGVASLKAQIAEKTKPGVAQNAGIWLLGLEVMQWEDSAEVFEERAIEFAVTFEVSPPSWEPRAGQQSRQPAPDEALQEGAIPEAFAMKGIVVGPTDPQVAAIAAFADRRSWVPIDMTQVDRIDFVCAGSLQNLVSGFTVAGKPVQVIGASPIIESLLLLIGFDPAVLEAK